MKFIMIVLITSCEPKRALSSPGMAPQIAAGDDRGNHAKRNQHDRRKISRTDSGPGRRKRRDVQLPFRTDVQQPCPERHRDRESGKDERRGQEQRVADAIGPPERAADEQPVGFERVVADGQHEHAANGKRRDDGNDGNTSDSGAD